MTLIMSYWHEPYSVIMLGDLLISRENPLKNATPALPSRFSAEQSGVNEYIARLQQKLIFVKPGLSAAWAGSEIVARNLLTLIRDEIGNDYRGERILEIIGGSGLTAKELESVSFIFCAIGDNGKIIVQDYLTKEFCFTPTHKFKFAGSGDYHFFEVLKIASISIVAGKGDQSVDDLTYVITRAALAFHSEITAETPHNFFYGGGFELIVPNVEQKSMEKIPLSYAYWGFRGQEITLIGPVIVYQYHSNGVLQIDRFTRNSGRWQHDPFLVGNFFASAADVLPLPPQLYPVPMVHFLIDQEQEREKVSCIFELTQQTLSLEHTEGSVELKIDEDGQGFQSIRKFGAEVSTTDEPH